MSRLDDIKEQLSRNPLDVIPGEDSRWLMIELQRTYAELARLRHDNDGLLTSISFLEDGRNTWQAELARLRAENAHLLDERSTLQAIVREWIHPPDAAPEDGDEGTAGE